MGNGLSLRLNGNVRLALTTDAIGSCSWRGIGTGKSRSFTRWLRGVAVCIRTQGLMGDPPFLSRRIDPRRWIATRHGFRAG